MSEKWEVKDLAYFDQVSMVEIGTENDANGYEQIGYIHEEDNALAIITDHNMMGEVREISAKIEHELNACRVWTGMSWKYLDMPSFRVEKIQALLTKVKEQ